MEQNPIKVALAEDDSMLREAISRILGLFPDIVLKFSASDGRQLLHLIRRDPRVDVVLMDLEMPVLKGIEATEKISREFPHIKVVILTVFDQEEKIFQAIKAGACGYMLKDLPPEELAQGIRNARNYGVSFSPEALTKSLELLRRADLSQFSPFNNKSDKILSEREIEILHHLSLGLSYVQIAGNLSISEGTVRKHLENIYRKLNAHNKVEALLKARRLNLLK